MKIVVGLGNPGEKYQHNRHNIGFMVVERLLAEITKSQILNPKQIQNHKFENNNKFFAELVQIGNVILVMPMTFMNESGKAVAAITHFYKVKLEDLYIVHDDLDIVLGSYKIQYGKGPQIHNGLRSVEEMLGTDQFWNVRVGVENREIRGNKGVPGVVYSLQDFKPQERGIIEGVTKQVVDDLMRRLSA